MATERLGVIDETYTSPNGIGFRATLDPPRRLHGLRFPVVPTGSLLAQVGGAAAALTGSWMQFGTAVTLMVAGVASVVLGTLREAGKV